jgi:preprotein translocase subunit SecG
MSNQQILLIAQAVTLFATGVLILLQQRGSGLSSVLGGSNQVYMTRRGVEKWIMFSTVFLIIAFMSLRTLSFYIQ